MIERLIHAALSIALLLAVAFLFSVDRRLVRPRVVVSALATSNRGLD